MQKSSRIANWLTIVISLMAFVVVLLLWLRGNEALTRLSVLNEEFNQLEKTAADKKKAQEANLARKRREGEVIQDEISSITQETVANERGLWDCRRYGQCVRA